MICRPTVDVFLFGNEELSTEQNKNIFLAVQNFVLKTKRFQVNRCIFHYPGCWGFLFLFLKAIIVCFFFFQNELVSNLLYTRFSVLFFFSVLSFAIKCKPKTNGNK